MKKLIMVKIMIPIFLIWGTSLLFFGEYYKDLRLSFYGLTILVMTLAILITWIIGDLQMILGVIGLLMKDKIKELDGEVKDG